MRKTALLLLLVIPSLAGCSSFFDSLNKDSSDGEQAEYQELMDDQKWESAINSIDEKLKEDPKDAGALADRALCYYHLDNYTSALRDANAALKIDTKSTKALDARAWTYRYMHEYKKAIADFTREIELAPDDASAYVGRADSYDAMHEGKKGLPDYEKALSIDGENATTYRNRGWTYLNLGNLKKAIEDFEEALHHDDSDISTYLNKATAFMRLETYDQAIKDLDKVLELDPSSYSVYIYRGTVYLFKNDLDAAIKEFELAKEHTSAGNAAWGDLYLYLTYRWMGKDNEARAAIVDAKNRSRMGDWPYPLLLYFDKQMSLKDVELLAVNPSEKTELRTWIGFDKLLSGDASGEEDLKWVREHGESNDSEYELALFAEKHKKFLRKNH